MKKQASTTYFFYQNGKLVTVSQGGQQRAIFRTADMPLAEQQSDSTNGLLATDRSNSVLAVQDGEEEPDHRFTAYGHDPTLQLTGALLGFNGEAFKAATTCYQLGNGYRAYSPALMRFHSPDSWSPFGDGGINAYCYCENDPINRTDPLGHDSFLYYIPLKIKPYSSLIKSLKRGPELARPTSSTRLAKKTFTQFDLSEKSYEEIRYMQRISKNELNKARESLNPSLENNMKNIDKFVTLENLHHQLTTALNEKITVRHENVIAALTEENAFRPSFKVQYHPELAQLMRDGHRLIIPSRLDTRIITPPY
ncbi:RHS repeat-associated core domain-containing protein [Pseudomonas sp. EMN2]|uniref:RHS repeat-associated core domain-containing protein n=1 Tax=Pseudomonas sp. EMN2 TaxID=2615212 RepID=UPI00129AE6C3|nr:RHS repeat-associated core domain-containing protein [Pseudomonas sp. EMN2]